MNYDVIAIIRGGGAGLEALDEVELLETLVKMNTAWMYGAGHEGEKLFILNIADKAIAIPHALGTYFRDHCCPVKIRGMWFNLLITN